MNCQVRSADRELYSGPAKMIVARSPRGEFAVLDQHAPLLAALNPGALRVITPDAELAFACFAGTLRVAEDRSVTVLADAVPVSEIDAEAARAELSSMPEESRGSDLETDRTRARLELLLHIKERYG